MTHATHVTPLTDKLLDDITARHRTPCNTYIVVFVATIGGFLFGYDTGVVSGAMLEIKRPGSGIASDLQGLTHVEQEVIVSSTIAAAAIGSLASGVIQRHRLFGRRTCAMLSSTLFAFGAILMAVVSSLWLMVVGRIVVGVAVGLASQVVPTFIAEVAPSHLRGCLTGLFNAMLILGQVAASGVCCAYAAVDQANGTLHGWRWMLGWGAFPAVTMLFGLFVLPESPQWLLKVPGDEDQAMRALVWLRGNPQVALQEMSAINQVIEDEKASERRVGKKTLLERLMKRRVMSALALGVGLQLLQQCVAINTIMYYSGTILEMVSSGGRECSEAAVRPAHSASAGLTQEDLRNVCLTIPVATCQLVGSFIGMALADSKGRRPLVLSSLMGCTVSLILLGFAFYPEQDIGWLALAGMCIYLLSFGIGMSPVPWIVNAEIYPVDERSVANSIATTANWIGNFCMSMTFLDLAEWLSTNRNCPSEHPDGAFWLYAVAAVVGLVILGWKMPETAGKTLEEMDDVFGGEEHKYKIERVASDPTLGGA